MGSRCACPVLLTRTLRENRRSASMLQGQPLLLLRCPHSSGLRQYCCVQQGALRVAKTWVVQYLRALTSLLQRTGMTSCQQLHTALSSRPWTVYSPQLRRRQTACSVPRQFCSSKQWCSKPSYPCTHQWANRFSIRGRRGRDIMCSSAAEDSASAGTYTLSPVHTLVQHYCSFTSCTRPYSQAITDFVNEAVLAYECGFSEADLKQQVSTVVQQLSSTQQQRQQEGGSHPTSSSTVIVTERAMQDFTEQGFLTCVCIVWATLMLSPKNSLKRWARSPAVSDDTLAMWRGFVSMIVTGWFEKRMAWYPLDRLQLELGAVQGVSPNQEVVAERARLVFTTLERVYPQFPSM